MKKISAICLIAITTCLFTNASTQARDESTQQVEGTVVSPNAFKVPYLGVDGTFTIDTKEIAATDPRNPKRVVFQKMEFFSFYKDLEGRTPVAANCRYTYKGAVGDPFYYPEQAKTSIWDQLTAHSVTVLRLNSGSCH